MTFGSAFLIFGICWLITALVMTMAWIIQQRSGNSGWVDVTWTIGVGVSALVAIWLGPAGAPLERTVIIAVMVLIWAGRLAGHVALRSSRISDDPRYERMRNDWGDRAPMMMFGLLQIQAICAIPLVAAVAFAAWHPSPLFADLGLLGLVLFLVAQFGSYLSDRQLSDFKQSRKSGVTSDAVCERGLWAYSRHPNYFFEWLIWTAFALLAIDLSGEWSIGLLAIAGPVTIYWLLRYVSGVPPLEAHMEDRYGDAYRDYQARVSVFFPAPPVERQQEDASKSAVDQPRRSPISGSPS